MAARAAWLHFIGGLKQHDVARRLGVSAAKAHRYITKAQADGLVHITVDSDYSVCAVLEDRLMRAYGLKVCRVAMDMPEERPLPLRALSVVGAEFIHQTVTSGAHQVVGFGHGRTLSACVKALKPLRASDVRFVSMLGGLTRSYAANPYDVIHKLADKSLADSYLMPVPLFANSIEDKKVMLTQAGVAATMELANQASLVIIGIGDFVSKDGTVAALARRDEETLDDLEARGACAELLGQFVHRNGKVMKTALDLCVMAPALDTLRGRDIVAIAGGEQKIGAIEAALKTGLLTGLIIDEATARRLVEDWEAESLAAE